MYSKEELREKLLVVKQQYVDKNKDRLEKIRPEWEEVQNRVPNITEIDPHIEFCSTKYLQDLWYYGRVTVSSAPLSGEVGRRFHYLIRDKHTGFILGMVGLASDLTIPIRDKHIGWTHQNKWEEKKINYLMNVQHAVSTPELSQYLTGKLCALSVRSKEVQDYFVQNYKHSLAVMTVTSLFGKSSLYNRLDGFIYLGTTKGYSSLLIPIEVKEKMREDFKATKGKHSEIYYNEDGSVKWAFGVVKGFQKLGKYGEVQREENFRGVYVIPLAYNYKEFLCSKSGDLNQFEHPSFDALTNNWKTRWMLPRIERLGGYLGNP
jgi:hypothetical protein